MSKIKFNNFNLIKIKSLNFELKSGIFKLWNENYPSQLEFKDINNLEQYLQNLKNATHYFMENENNKLVNNYFAWAVVFERDTEVWFAIIIDKKLQKKGIGSIILEILKADFPVLNGWVIDNNDYIKLDGTQYISPLEFYIKNGFSIVENIRLETDKISALKINWSRVNNIENNRGNYKDNQYSEQLALL